jgi:hypothetical protein
MTKFNHLIVYYYWDRGHTDLISTWIEFAFVLKIKTILLTIEQVYRFSPHGNVVR